MAQYKYEKYLNKSHHDSGSIDALEPQTARIDGFVASVEAVVAIELKERHRLVIAGTIAALK